MKFSEFLQNIYKCKNDKITKQEVFVLKLFKTCCSSFTYTEDYCKKLLNGNKPLSDDVRNLVSDNCDYRGLPSFFEENINNNRFQDILDAFDIEKDEKKDLSIFAEALSYQFENYIKYGENQIPTSVKTIYETLIDQAGNGKIKDANEKAVFLAKQYLYNAIASLVGLSANKDVLSNKGPFEAFFSNINSIFRTYEQNCNREGRILYKRIHETIVNNNDERDSYLKIITEIGSIPLELVKQVKYVVYDNYTFKDKVTETTIKLFEEFENKKKVEALKSISFYPVNEIYFTEFIEFVRENNSHNLLTDAIYMMSKAEAILNALEVNLPIYPLMDKINKEINSIAKKLDLNLIQYMSDGTYYPETEEIEYASTMEPRFEMRDGRTRLAGDLKMPISTIPMFKDLRTFDEYLNELFSWHCFLQTTIPGDMMNELITINEDGTCRYYMFPPTCKAKVYREIRMISSRVIEDKTVGFITINQMLAYRGIDESVKMTTKERQPTGQEILFGFGYYDGKGYSIAALMDDIRNKNMRILSSKFNVHIYNPIIDKINEYVKSKEKSDATIST